jgi:thiol-disulfide isomerase/thioredoxin
LITNPDLIMKNKFPAALAVVVLLLSSQHIFAGGTNDPTVELRDLVAQIKIKLAQGQKAESDFAPELKQFDNLLAEHQGEKTDAVARILYMKATLYGEVFGDTAKAGALMKQLETDFQGTQFVVLIERQEAKAAESKKIQDTLAIGTKFPGFNEQDINGNPISVSNYKGKVVMIDFWATWCGPCRGEVPNVVATYQRYHNKGFEIVGVSLDQDKQKLLDYTQQQNMAWPQFFDGLGWNNKLAIRYGVESIPASYLLDGNGNIIAKDLRGEELEAVVAKAVAAN